MPKLLPLALLFLAISCNPPKEKAQQEICFDINQKYPTGKAIIYLRQGDSIFPVEVEYLNVNGLKVYQGDILLKESPNLGRMRYDTARIRSFSISTYGTLWPGGIVTYDEDPSFTPAQQNMISAAITYWSQQTGLVFAQHGTEANWVHFMPCQQGQSSSAVGMAGGQQYVNLSPTTQLGNVIHEIGHAVGLYHEQCRPDRDQYITVNYSNIKAGYAGQFNIQQGNVNTAYDYGSIMHYSAEAFAIDNTIPTITPLNPAPNMGQRTGLSALDIQGIKIMYPQPEIG